MAKKVAKKKLSDGQKAGIGAGLTAAALSAAGAYFLYGSKNAKSNRKKVKGWALKAKGEVLESLEKVESITEKEFQDLVKSATGAYGTVKNASVGEVKDFKKEMQQHWNALQKNQIIKKIVSAKKPTTQTAKKVAKKTTKKTVTKVATKKTPAKKK